MRSHDRITMTGKALPVGVAAVLIALTVTACGQTALSPDPAACKAAMQAAYLKTSAGQVHAVATPAICKGVPKAEVQRFAQQIQAGH